MLATRARVSPCSERCSPESEGLTAWGECVAGEHPYFSDEMIDTAWIITETELAPKLLEAELEGGGEVPRVFQRIERREALHITCSSPRQVTHSLCHDTQVPQHLRRARPGDQLRVALDQEQRPLLRHDRGENRRTTKCDSHFIRMAIRTAMHRSSNTRRRLRIFARSG